MIFGDELWLKSCKKEDVMILWQSVPGSYWSLKPVFVSEPSDLKFKKTSGPLDITSLAVSPVRVPISVSNTEVPS